MTASFGAGQNVICTGNGGLPAKVQPGKFRSGGTLRAQQEEGSRQADLAPDVTSPAGIRREGRLGFRDDSSAGRGVSLFLLAEPSRRAEQPRKVGLACRPFADP